jgi:hypothetical protein
MSNEFNIKNGFISNSDSRVIGVFTANTISATTYQNLPVDPNYYVTAFTYSNNVFTVKQTGQSDLTATINSVTGWTVNGVLTVTGDTSLQGVTANTISATTISGGTMVITTTPTTDNTLTQVLSRDPVTGTVELVDTTSFPFNYGLANAIMTGTFLT